MTFTVTLSEAVQGGLTVTPGLHRRHRRRGHRLRRANTTALTFSGTKGETKTFTVSTTEDAALEAAETFTVGLGLSNAPSGVTFSDTGTGTINDDDSAAVTVNDAEADEGDGITFTVTLSEAVQGGLKVTPGYTNVTAAGTDYTANTTALTFGGTKGETKTFTVSTTEDAVLEADETFTVGLSVSGTSLGVTSPPTPAPAPSTTTTSAAAVTVNDADADEGNSMTFTVTLDKAVQGGLTVTPGYTDGTAADTDYTKNTAALSFTGTANETRTFTVSTTEDAVVEGGETFTVGLSVSGTSLSVTSTDTGTGTINNDDGAVVTVNNADADEGDSMTFTVTLDKAVQGGLTVTPGYTDGTAAGHRLHREHHGPVVHRAKANETKTLTVATVEDAVLEADETFTVGLSVSGNSSVTATDTGTGTINNDDGAALTVNDADADEGDGMTFTVTLGAAVQGGLTVTPGYANVTAVGTDYTANTTALNFSGTKGETKTFTVATTEDNLVEGHEAFTVGLSASNSDVTSTGTGTGTINNDDGAPAVNLSLNPSIVGEGASGTTVTVTAAFSNTNTYAGGPDGDGLGGRQRHGDLGGRLRRGPQLQRHDRRGDDQRHGDVHPDPHPGHPGRGQRDDRRGRQRDDGLTVNGATLTLTDDDGAPSVNLSLSPSSVGRRRVGDAGDGDGGVLEPQHLRDGHDGDRVGGRQRHGGLGDRLRRGLRLRRDHRRGAGQRHGDVHPDPGPGHPG